MILFCKFIFNYCNFLIIKPKHFLRNLYYPSVVIIEFTFSIHDIVFASFVKEMYQATSQKRKCLLLRKHFLFCSYLINDIKPSKICVRNFVSCIFSPRFYSLQSFALPLYHFKLLILKCFQVDSVPLTPLPFLRKGSEK